MKIANLCLCMLLAACASGPEYCVVMRDGLTFERDADPTAMLKKRDWTEPATVPEWKR